MTNIDNKPKVLFSSSRATLTEAMRDVIEVSSLDDIENYEKETYACYSLAFAASKGKLKIEPYGFDERIGWETYIVTDNTGVVGFTNANLEYIKPGEHKHDK